MRRSATPLFVEAELADKETQMPTEKNADSIDRSAHEASTHGPEAVESNAMASRPGVGSSNGGGNGTGDDTLARVVGRLLRERGETLATAESCTGGLIGDLVTDVAGSSDYYRGGVVAYSNDLKQSLLGVRAETLAAHGAVSEEIAAEMAQGALARSHAGSSDPRRTHGVPRLVAGLRHDGRSPRHPHPARRDAMPPGHHPAAAGGLRCGRIPPARARPPGCQAGGPG